MLRDCGEQHVQRQHFTATEKSGYNSSPVDFVLDGQELPPGEPRGGGPPRCIQKSAERTDRVLQEPQHLVRAPVHPVPVLAVRIHPPNRVETLGLGLRFHCARTADPRALQGDTFSISALHLAIKVPYFSDSWHKNEKVTPYLGTPRPVPLQHFGSPTASSSC
eukprot:SAG31_NODE_1018_length_10354_cov_10.995514_13_plen_163_part_00